jgi:hypothetical protein
MFPLPPLSHRHSNLCLPEQTYVYSVVYMASHDPSKYRFPTPVYVLLFTTLLTAYYMCVITP